MAEVVGNATPEISPLFGSVQLAAVEVEEDWRVSLFDVVEA